MSAIVWLTALTLFFTPPPETCASIHALVGGELVEWIGYERGGWELPADLEMISRIDFADGGVLEYWSENEQARYIIVFTSYAQSADGNGNNFGSHEFCGPYRIAD